PLEHVALHDDRSRKLAVAPALLFAPRVDHQGPRRYHPIELLGCHPKRQARPRLGQKHLDGPFRHARCLPQPDRPRHRTSSRQRRGVHVDPELSVAASSMALSASTSTGRASWDRASVVTTPSLIISIMSTSSVEIKLTL